MTEVMWECEQEQSAGRELPCVQLPKFKGDTVLWAKLNFVSFNVLEALVYLGVPEIQLGKYF